MKFRNARTTPSVLLDPPAPQKPVVDPQKVVCWDHIQMMHRAMRVSATPSSTERFIKPFQRALKESIEYAAVEGFSRGGVIPDIFRAPAEEGIQFGPLGAYVRAGAILAASEAARLPSTQEPTAGYKGGDMYSPLLRALVEAQDYTQEVGRALAQFNVVPLRTPPKGGTKWISDGPSQPGFYIPSSWGFW